MPADLPNGGMRCCVLGASLVVNSWIRTGQTSFEKQRRCLYFSPTPTEAQQYGGKPPAENPPNKTGDLIMTTPIKPGVSFNETMKGGFALGETDPRKGEMKGDAAGTELAIHCDIDIADSYAFIADPQHFAAMH